MVKVFIIYGKEEGEKIGARIHEHFTKNGIDSFLASPKSSSITAGVDFQQIIDQELKDVDIAVVVCTPGINKSAAALDEIEFVKDKIPIVPYVRGRTKIPTDLQDRWRPIKFKKNKGSDKNNLITLELTMWRTLEAFRNTIPAKTEERVEVETVVSPELIRRRRKK